MGENLMLRRFFGAPAGRTKKPGKLIGLISLPGGRSDIIIFYDKKKSMLL